MTQEILYCSPSGIVLTSDSLVVQVHEDGRREYQAARKVVPLGQWAILVTAGAFAGVQISQRYAQRSQMEEWSSLERLGPSVRSYFEEEYGQLICRHREWFAGHPDAYRSLYVLVAGRAQNDFLAPWQALLLSSEDLELPLRVQRIREVLTIPRRLGLEGHLMARMKQAAPLEDVAAFCTSAMETLAARDPGQVGGPFHSAILDGAGVRWWQPTGGEAA